MTDAQLKHPFVSPAWVDIAQRELEDIVSTHASDDDKFTVCESFAQAPAEFADADGFAAWYFSVDGKSVRVGTGKVADADVHIQATWAVALTRAKLVYTPELLAEWAKNPPPPPEDPNLKITGDMAGLPVYLAELHNRLAVITE